MRRRTLAVIAGTVLALASVSTSFAAAPNRVSSRISIGYNHSTELFHGKVRSSNAECRAERTVKVFQETANGPALQGRVMTNADGRWKLEVMHAEGHYFAVAPKHKPMHGQCGRAKSRIVDVM
jgi:hypothetical protein